jgi:hypothetical protein
MVLDLIELPSIRCGNCGFITPMNYNHLKNDGVECENCHAMINLDKKSSEFYKRKISSKMNTKYSSERERDRMKRPDTGLIIIILIFICGLVIVCVVDYNGTMSAYNRGEDYDGILFGHISYERMKSTEAAFLQSEMVQQQMELDRSNQHTHKTY